MDSHRPPQWLKGKARSPLLHGPRGFPATENPERYFYPAGQLIPQREMLRNCQQQFVLSTFL